MDLQMRRDAILAAACREGLLDAHGLGVAAFIDLDALETNVRALHAAFPPDVSTFHAFAAKANPTVPVLEVLRHAGMGCEVASPGELAQAVAAGFDPSRIVYDSPAKTRDDLRTALVLGVAVNADSLAELDRLAFIRAGLADAGTASSSVIGVRLNPEVGTGSIEAMSTAGSGSKFGVPIGEERRFEAAVEAIAASPWVTRLHAHIGSQGCPLELIGRGIARVIELADAVERRTGSTGASSRRITSLDIGGGLPVDFGADSFPSRFDDYVEVVRRFAPRALSGEFELVTEFGRSIIAKQGFTAARVEYVKPSGMRPVVVTHAGVQLATRTVFMPEAWPIRIELRDAEGRLRDGPLVEQDVAGPACFSGDLLARRRPLPSARQGDVAVLLDTGAYYASNHFAYNSLQAPVIFGARIANAGTPDSAASGEPEVAFEVLRPAETLESLLMGSGASPVAAHATVARLQASQADGGAGVG